MREKAHKDADEEEEDLDDASQDDDEGEDVGRNYEHKAKKAAGPQALAQERRASKHASNVDIGEPMFVWIMLLLIAVVVRFVLSYTALVPVHSPIYSLLGLYMGFLFNPPGIFVLPLIVGAIIGAEVGTRSFSMKSSVKSGLLNGVYAAVVYIVTILVLSVVLDYLSPNGMQLSSLISNTIALPVVTLIIVIEAFAILSYSRKTDG